MAGFFGFGNYEKPGRGVSKDEPQKHSFFVFFEIYFRKFGKLVQLNLIYTLCCVPFFIPLLLVLLFVGNYTLTTAIALLPLVGVAVVTTGFTYVLRNYSRQEHAFLWSDFKETIQKNWKQALIVGIIDYFAFFILKFSITFYNSMLPKSSYYSIPLIICFFVALTLIFMQYYLFVLMITFDLTMRQLLRNSLLFAFAGLLRNILISVFVGLIVLFCITFPPLAYIFGPIFLLSTAGLIVTFNVWPLIDRYMIPKPDEDEEEEDKAAIFEDKGRQ